jgi:hypothetical protein
MDVGQRSASRGHRVILARSNFKRRRLPRSLARSLCSRRRLRPGLARWPGQPREVEFQATLAAARPRESAGSTSRAAALTSRECRFDLARLKFKRGRLPRKLTRSLFDRRWLRRNLARLTQPSATGARHQRWRISKGKHGAFLRRRWQRELIPWDPLMRASRAPLRTSRNVTGLSAVSARQMERAKHRSPNSRTISAECVRRCLVVILPCMAPLLRVSVRGHCIAGASGGSAAATTGFGEMPRENVAGACATASQQ